MHNSRFVILTGHLNDYPISDLIGILRHQRKTGRLLIEYAKGPAVFFFHEGDLVDAKLNDLTGLQAVCFALGQPPASFNFNPLIQPSQKTIEDSLQRTVSELFGCWDDTNFEIASGVVDVPLLEPTSPEPDMPPAVPRAFPKYEAAEPLALPPAVISSRRPASLLIMTAAGLLTLGVSTGIALSGGFRGNHAGERTPAAIQKTIKSEVVDAASDLPKNSETIAAKSRARSTRESNSESNRHAAKKNDNSVKDTARASQSQTESVTVVMEIENGRVLRASIANPKPGMDGYEALALRVARQRRYSSQQNGRETVKIKVSPSDQ
jgi:hypothetical protein